MNTNRTSKLSEKKEGLPNLPPFSPYEFGKSSVYQSSRMRSLATNSQINPNKTLAKIKRDNQTGNADYLDQYLSPVTETGFSMHELSMDQKKK